jgi:hypothetical protein
MNIGKALRDIGKLDGGVMGVINRRLACHRQATVLVFGG